MKLKPFVYLPPTIFDGKHVVRDKGYQKGVNEAQQMYDICSSSNNDSSGLSKEIKALW